MAAQTSINIIVGIISLFISLVGTLGNLLTIVGFYYAKHKRRYKFHENWRSSIIYIINLSVIDFFFCACIQIQVFAALSFVSYENGHRIYHDPDSLWCTFSTHSQIFFGILDSSAIALISLTRAFALTNNSQWELICEKKRYVSTFIAFPWIFSILLYFPAFGHVFARDVATGFCYPKIHASWYVENIRYIIHGTSAIAILFSYCYIYFYVSKYSKEQNKFNLNSANSKSIHSRNVQIAKTMAIVSFSSIVLMLPWSVVQILHASHMITPETYSLLHVVTYAILILQYSINMFIYVWRKDAYTKAIMDVVYIFLPNFIRKRRRNIDRNTIASFKSRTNATKSNVMQENDVVK